MLSILSWSFTPILTAWQDKENRKIYLTMLVCDWKVCFPWMDSLRIITFAVAAFITRRHFYCIDDPFYTKKQNLNIACLLALQLLLLLLLMNWIYIALFPPLKALYIKSIIESRHIHTGGGGAPCVATAAPGQTDVSLAANQLLRPPTNIHSHS